MQSSEYINRVVSYFLDFGIWNKRYPLCLDLLADDIPSIALLEIIPKIIDSGSSVTVPLVKFSYKRKYDNGVSYRDFGLCPRSETTKEKIQVYKGLNNVIDITSMHYAVYRITNGN